jgi:hypothetical protein
MVYDEITESVGNDSKSRFSDGLQAVTCFSTSRPLSTVPPLK